MRYLTFFFLNYIVTYLLILNLKMFFIFNTKMKTQTNYITKKAELNKILKIFDL